MSESNQSLASHTSRPWRTYASTSPPVPSNETQMCRAEKDIEHGHDKHKPLRYTEDIVRERSDQVVARVVLPAGSLVVYKVESHFSIDLDEVVTVDFKDKSWNGKQEKKREQHDVREPRDTISAVMNVGR